MSNHIIVFEVNAELNRFNGKITSSSHEEWEPEDKYALAFSVLHLAGSLFAELEELPRNALNNVMASDVIASIIKGVHEYLELDGTVFCSCEDEDADTHYIRYERQLKKGQHN